MEAKFNNIADEQALEDWFELSAEALVVLFKHSSTCPISSAAYNELAQFSAAPVAIIVVQKARSVSSEVAARVGIAHQSPQAIIIKDGKAVWSASHFDITAEALTSAIAEQTSQKAAHS